MGRMYLNEVWKAKMLDLMATQKVFEFSTGITMAAQWIILTLEGKGIPFKVLTLGAGVKKITTDLKVCPKCHGIRKV